MTSPQYNKTKSNIDLPHFHIPFQIQDHQEQEQQEQCLQFCPLSFQSHHNVN